MAHFRQFLLHMKLLCGDCVLLHGLYVCTRNATVVVAMVGGELLALMLLRDFFAKKE